MNGNDRRKIVVEQDERSGFARDVGAATAHGDADGPRTVKESDVL
jgi:hypothetical protein